MYCVIAIHTITNYNVSSVILFYVRKLMMMKLTAMNPAMTGGGQLNMWFILLLGKFFCHQHTQRMTAASSNLLTCQTYTKFLSVVESYGLQDLQLDGYFSDCTSVDYLQNNSCCLLNKCVYGNKFAGQFFKQPRWKWMTEQ